MAYYFFLSLFPLVLMLFALTGIIGGDEAFASIAAAASQVVPQYGWQFVSELIREVTHRSRPGVLSTGILLTLWAGSNGIAALVEGLNTIYEVPEGRGWWRRRAISIAILAVGATALVLGTAALLVSRDWLRARGLGSSFPVLWWPFALASIIAALWLMYRYLPARNAIHTRTGMVAGALVATSLWVLAGVCLRLYVTHFSRYGRTYGTVGAVIVLLLWFYVAAMAILLGAEVAAVVERMRTTGRLERSDPQGSQQKETQGLHSSPRRASRHEAGCA